MRWIGNTLVFIGVVGAILSAPHSIMAQSSDINLSISPAAPGPNEQVTVRVEALTFEESDATIQWRRDGEVVRGANDTTLQIRTGDIGSETRVSVSVTQDNGVTHSDQVTLRPADVEFVWEADTYTPPFYKGKARYTPMADVTLLAVPHTGTSHTPDELLYEWRTDGRTVSSKAAGNRSYTINGSFTEQNPSTSVRVYTPGGTLVAQKTISLSPVEPEVSLHSTTEDGIVRYETAIADATELTQQQMTLVAAPLFFSISSPTDEDLSITWEMNNEEIAAPDPQNTLPVSTDGDQGGQSRISVSALHNTHISQQASVSTLVRFGSRQADDVDF